MRIRKSVLDDGFLAYLTEDAAFVGDAGIPVLMDLDYAQIPRDMIPFAKANTCKNKRQYIHFYQHDKEFSRVLTGTKRYLDTLKEYDGVITPDCSMLIGQSKCLQQSNTYMNRAVGYYLQRNGIPVIPNIRWSDEKSFEYCFLGVPAKSIVSVSTHGCIGTKEQRSMFRIGMKALIRNLHPRAVLVHGSMPDDIFGEFIDQTDLYLYKSQIERTRRKARA